MDNSTDGVTLFGGFIFDILAEYRGNFARTCAPAFAMAEHLDANQPTKLVPIQLYNEICQWIEEHLGEANIREAGRAIGARVYSEMIKDKSLGASPTPQDILKTLKRMASIMIQDPKGRGWDILDMTERRAVMRRTQTFNCTLQDGLLVSLVEKTGVLMPRSHHLKCVRDGAEFCDYEVTWTPKLAPSQTRGRR